MNIVLIALLVLGATGLLAAVLLYVIALRFRVEEDPRIDQVAEALPGANCGGCGYAGCRALAEACVKAETLDGLLCPVGGAETMKEVASILGKEAVAAEPKVAVIRCNGTCEARPRTSVFDGSRSCKIMHACYVGETACPFGCLGCGDCVAACQFDALSMNPETGLPEVDEAKCTSCGKCVKACPRHIIELRLKGNEGAKMVVLCSNKDKGAVTRKACLNGCIGCGKCQTVCGFDAIKVENNLAYIDASKCVLCRDCESACPTGAIHGMNLPVLAKNSQPAAAPVEGDETKEKVTFDPVCAAKIRALPTQRAQYPYFLTMAQKS